MWSYRKRRKNISVGNNKNSGKIAKKVKSRICWFSRTDCRNSCLFNLYEPLVSSEQFRKREHFVPCRRKNVFVPLLWDTNSSYAFLYFFRRGNKNVAQQRYFCNRSVLALFSVPIFYARNGERSGSASRDFNSN